MKLLAAKLWRKEEKKVQTVCKLVYMDTRMSTATL